MKEGGRGGRGHCLREAKAVQSVEAIHPRLCHRLAPSNISRFFLNSFIVSALIAFFCLVFLPPFLLPSVPAHSSFFPFPQPLTSSFLFAQPPLLSRTLSLLLSRSPHLTSCRSCYIIHTAPTVFSELNTRGSSR